MVKYRLFLLAIALGVAGVFFIDRGFRKSIKLVIDGEETSITTTSLTVGAVIQGQNITLTVGDLVSPNPVSWANAGDTIAIRHAAWFTLEADGKRKSVRTVERIPANVLALEGIQLYPGDQVWIDGRLSYSEEPLEAGGDHSIQVRRAYPIDISREDDTLAIHSSSPTLGEALWKAGLRLNVKDRLDVPVETPLAGPLSVSIKEARRLQINLAGETIAARSAGSTVGEALLDAGIPLQSLDYSIPADGSPLPSSGEIRVFKVQERFLLEAEPLPFETETRPAADVEIDNQQIVQPGVYGLLARRIRLLLVDGEEITRQVEAEYIAQEPQAEIMGYGTKIVPHTMNTPDGEITYWRALNMYAVSYKPSSAGDNITATGAVLQKGIVAIDPDYILYGTQMYIPGYGFGVAADTGGGVVGRLIDLGYTDADYISWHQWVTVYFLWPPPGFVAWVIP